MNSPKKYSGKSSCSTIALPIFPESIQELRAKRLSGDAALDGAIDVKRLKLNENVLERNLSPSQIKFDSLKSG